MTSDFTSVFLAFFVLTVAIRLWLKWRHIAFVTSNRAAVPASFAERIDLPSHQKAADYTIARCKMAVFDILVEAGLLLALTLGGDGAGQFRIQISDAQGARKHGKGTGAKEEPGAYIVRPLSHAA